MSYLKTSQALLEPFGNVASSQLLNDKIVGIFHFKTISFSKTENKKTHFSQSQSQIINLAIYQ